MLVEPVVVEHDKLIAITDKLGQTAESALNEHGIRRSEPRVRGCRRGLPVAEANTDIDDAPVVRFLQKVLMDAINEGASDIHFEPYEKFYRIRFRVDGVLREVAQPPIAIKDKLSSRIKVISRLDISEKRVPQDGRMKLVLSKTRAIDFRVSTLPTLFGEKIVMRILDPSQAKLGIDALGYDAGPERDPARSHSASLRHGARDRTDRIWQDGVAVHVSQYLESAGHQYLDCRRSSRNPAGRYQSGQRQ